MNWQRMVCGMSLQLISLWQHGIIAKILVGQKATFIEHLNNICSYFVLSSWLTAPLFLKKISKNWKLEKILSFKDFGVNWRNNLPYSSENTS